MKNRYAKQIALPEITARGQEKLKNARILMVGAGGLGAAALPYLAGAGVGHITIADPDAIDLSNLHRQTIYKESETGKNKAECAAAYLRALNSEIDVRAIPEKIKPETAQGFNLILDGSDNFETKSLLNDISIATRTPLISASVESFQGSAGVFAGYEHNAPCYHCLHPELPLAACNCNDAGILGTAAGLAGLYQAHLVLCFLLGIGEARAGTILSFDFKNFRTRLLRLEKNPACPACAQPAAKPKEKTMNIPLLHPSELREDCLVIDVRTPEETAADPIPGALHMPLDSVPARLSELPRNKPLAFACASNIRSRKAAEYAGARGYENICVLDRLAS